MRLFFAIPLPDELKTRLSGFQQRARALGIEASWPDPRGFHLTLAFLGETEDADASRILAVARASVASHGAFSLRTSALGGFPADRRARVLWLGLEEEPRLDALCADLRRGLKAAGCTFDEKTFKAHLTLARLRVPTDLGRFGPGPEPCAFWAKELVLFQSLGTPTGAHYRTVETLRLP